MMGSGLIFFNSFYLLLWVAFFSGLRIIRHIIRSFILPVKTQSEEQPRKFISRFSLPRRNVGYWSSYYIMFGVCSIYNFILLIAHPLYLTKSLHFFWVSMVISLLAGLRLILLAFFKNPSRFSIVLHFTVIIYEIIALFVLIPSYGGFWGVLWIFLPMVLWPINLIPEHILEHSITRLVASPQKFVKTLDNIYIDVRFWFIALFEVILQYFGFSLGFW